MKYIMYTLIFASVVIASFFIYKNYFENKKNIIISNTKNSLGNNNNMVNNSNKKEYKIVAFGDSLTAGYGVDLKDSYPSILQDALNKGMTKVGKEGQNVNFKIINMGVSGETTTGGLERVDFAISQNPDLILLGLGANDMLRATDPKLAKDNLEKIIISLQAKNIPIIILGMESQVSNGFEYKNNFDNIYPALAKKYNLPLVPFFLKGVVGVNSFNTSDGIHPNRSGYIEIIDENILPVLLPLLKSL